MKNAETKEIKVKVVVGEFLIKKEDPEEMHLKKDDDNFEMHIRQELPKEIIEWFKTL